jgi:catalase
MSSLAEQAVDAINATSGRHPGFRAVHAKGRVCAARFEPSGLAADLTTAQHMREPVTATVRFSNASGDPSAHDRLHARGMAVKFHLPAGGDTDIVAVTLGRFIVRTPEQFVQLNRTLRPGNGGLPRPSLGTLWFLLRHPDLIKPIGDARSVEPIVSYAACHFNALHAFRWIDSSGAERHVRYGWEPAASVESLADTAPKNAGRDYLQDEIAERLRLGPVHFTLRVQIAGERDRLDDPTAIWKEPLTVEAGTLAVERIEDSVVEPLVFDPTRLTAGIELSADPILRFRPDAYDVSVNRRT